MQVWHKILSLALSTLVIILLSVASAHAQKKPILIVRGASEVTNNSPEWWDRFCRFVQQREAKCEWNPSNQINQGELSFGKNSSSYAYELSVLENFTGEIKIKFRQLDMRADFHPLEWLVRSTESRQKNQSMRLVFRYANAYMENRKELHRFILANFSGFSQSIRSLHDLEDWEKTWERAGSESEKLKLFMRTSLEYHILFGTSFRYFAANKSEFTGWDYLRELTIRIGAGSQPDMENMLFQQLAGTYFDFLADGGGKFALRFLPSQSMALSYWYMLTEQTLDIARQSDTSLAKMHINRFIGEYPEVERWQQAQLYSSNMPFVASLNRQLLQNSELVPGSGIKFMNRLHSIYAGNEKPEGEKGKIPDRIFISTDKKENNVNLLQLDRSMTDSWRRTGGQESDLKALGEVLQSALAGASGKADEEQNGFRFAITAPNASVDKKQQTNIDKKQQTNISSREKEEDLLAVVNVLGTQLSAAGAIGNTRFRVVLDVYGDYAVVRSFAFDSSNGTTLGKNTTEDQSISNSASAKWYQAGGISSSYGFVVEADGLEFGVSQKTSRFLNSDAFRNSVGFDSFSKQGSQSKNEIFARMKVGKQASVKCGFEFITRNGNLSGYNLDKIGDENRHFCSLHYIY